MRFIYFIPLLIISACAVPRESGYGYKVYVPNGVEVRENLYCDQTEIANIHWAEFVAYQARIFGKDSEEYRSALPDTTCWADLDTSLMYLGKNYFMGTDFSNYPVVGITQKQVAEFCRWRSDRVMEVYLYLYFDYNYVRNQSRENYFTIERYIANELQDFPYDPKVKYYIEFRLPTLVEREIVLAYWGRRKRKKSEIHAAGMDVESIEKYGMLTRAIPDCVRKKKRLFDIKGNVAEWSSEEGISFGGSWKDSLEKIESRDMEHSSPSNAWTGARCVARWVRID
jgi:hypothetical protein